MQSYIAEKQYPSIYIFLKEHGFSENYIKNLRKVLGYIMLNGKAVTINTPLKCGDRLQVNASPNTKSSVTRCILGLDVVYEDDFYLVVNKPPELACTPSRSHYSNNLGGAICNYMDKKCDDFVLRIVNRLDKDTSGLVIIAKDSVAQKELQDARKVYHALCTGRIEKETVIDSPIATVLNDEGFNRQKRELSPDGKAATTFVQPICYYADKDITLVSCTLAHGRTHQIRIHLASIGHALLGDKLYGTTSPLISHAALVCKKITFTHPFSKQKVTLTAPYPNDIANLLS